MFEQSLYGSVDEPKKSFDPRSDRKTLQLCRQVERALVLALAGELGDDQLREVWVDSVDPAGGAGHLLIRVGVPSNASVPEVLGRLNEKSPRLRSLIAQAICRKRVPMLSFVAVAGSHGGDHV